MADLMNKYPKIPQLKDVVYEVKQKSSYEINDDGIAVASVKPLPTLDFVGTVKLHGTNAAVVQTSAGIHFQSRNRILTLDNDNAGFANAMSELPWENAFEELRITHRMDFDKEPETISIFGEWCGGNIQSGVALTQLEKQFVIFGLQIDGEWINIEMNFGMLNYAGITVITDYPTWHVSIDFNEVYAVGPELEDITKRVERLCPFGLAHGVEGIGEGVVWTCTTPGWESLRFKVKGQEHSKSNVKTFSAADTASMELMDKFARTALTEERLKHGLDYLREMNLPLIQKSTGDYLRYVVADVIVEEARQLEELGIDPKKVGKALSHVAKIYYFRNLETV